MRLLGAVLTATLLCSLATSAFAQSAVPDPVRSSTLTRAQETELNRRLGTLQQRFRALARETDLREGAVRNIAIEIFGADPNLDYETYVALIDAGARELRTYLTDARARSDPDPAAAAIRQRAIAAAEDGRLTEARSLYDQLIAANRSARQRTRDAEDLADAADMAEAARLAYVSADYLDAARRYGEAAELAPARARERWEYTVWRGSALYSRGRLFVESEPMREAITAYEAALVLRSRTSAPLDWAEVQNELGNALSVQGERGVSGALERAVAVYEAALTVRTRAADPNGWAQTQMNLGAALQVQGERGVPDALERAVAAYEAALSVNTREASPVDWADAQNNLGAVLFRQSERGAPGTLERAVLAYEAALTVRTREADPVGWALTQNNLGAALRLEGQRGVPGALERAVLAYEASLTVATRETNPSGWAAAQSNLGNVFLLQGALERAVVAYQAALTVMTREANPVGWATTQMNLGSVLLRQGQRGAPGALEQAVVAYEAALTVTTREANSRGWAGVNYNLAHAYRGAGRYAEALAAAQGALEVFEQLADTFWADRTRAFIARLSAE